MTILCICAQVTESEYREFCKDNKKFFEDNDFMIRIEEIRKEIE